MASELVVNHGESAIEVSVTATGDDFVAKLGEFECKIGLAESNNLPTAASIGWDFADLKTGKKGRDKEMLHWLDHAANPKGQFVMTKSDLKEGSIHVSGQLTMHQVAREITIPLTIKREGDRAEFEGTAKLDHRDFGLPKIVKFVLLKVDPVVTIHFKIAGTVR